MKIIKSNNFRFENFFNSKRFGVNKTKFNSFSNSANIFYDPNNDYYKLLSINEKSDNKEIKKSFYKLSLINHPDKGGNEESFKKINMAYEILKDEDLKRKYDSLRNEFVINMNKKLKMSTSHSFKSTNYNEKPNYKPNEKNNYSNNTNYYKNRDKNFNEKFYKKNNTDKEFKDENKHDFNWESNFEDVKNENNYQYYYDDFNKSENFYNKNSEKDYFKKSFYEYYNKYIKYTNFSFRNRKNEFNQKENLNKKNVKTDSANDFNFLNDNLTENLDSSTVNYFNKFKINRMNNSKPQIKISKFTFEQKNVHFSENRLKKLDEYLKNKETKEKLLHFFSRSRREKLKENPFEIKTNDDSKKSEYDISSYLKSKKEADSEGVNNRIKFSEFYKLMNKKLYFFSFIIILSINFYLSKMTRKSCN